MKIKPGKFWLLAPAFVAGLSVVARAASVTATLDSDQGAVGEPAQLTVTVTGSQEQPSVPSVDGLDITPVGQSTQIEVINGSMTANVCDTYQVTPQREGTFTIPAIRVGDAASQPITLHVGGGSGTAASPAQGQPATPGGSPSPPAPAIGPGSNEVVPSPENRFGMVQVNLPQRDFYVGELIPVEIKAYVPDYFQATITDLPQMSSNAFAMDPLSTKPDRTSQILNGQIYTVLTWHSALTPVKAGDYPFSLEMPETVVVPQRMRQMGLDGNDPFGNFFRNAFAPMGVKKEVTLQSNVDTLKVQSLPGTGRPAGFGGAVGQFEIEASATPTQANAGDPITLRLKISGTGNFDRVSSDMLPGDSHWKTYSAKSRFDPADSVGYQGVKTIEQPIIANDSNVSAIPSLTFSFFDPETGRYVTRTTAPISVAISGASLPATPAAVNAGAGAAPVANSPAPSPPAPSDELRPNKVEPGLFVATLQPIFLNPWFIAGQGVPLLALVGGVAFLRRRRLASQPDRAHATAVQKNIREQIAAMDEAMRNNQTDAFFIHARNALQQRLGHEWKMRPEAITFADIESRLGGESETIRPIFEMADQASYSDLHFEEADLQQWRQVVVNELQTVEKN